MPRSDRPPPSPGRPPGRPAEDRTPSTGQAALDGLGDVEAYRPAPGSVQRAVETSIEAAKASGRLGLIEAALSAVAIEQGRAVDLAVRRHDPYAISQTTRALLAILDRLGLAPTLTAPSTDEGDPIGAFLAGLTGPQVCDPAHP